MTAYGQQQQQQQQHYYPGGGTGLGMAPAACASASHWQWSQPDPMSLTPRGSNTPRSYTPTPPQQQPQPQFVHQFSAAQFPPHQFSATGMPQRQPSQPQLQFGIGFQSGLAAPPGIAFQLNPSIPSLNAASRVSPSGRAGLAYQPHQATPGQPVGSPTPILMFQRQQQPAPADPYLTQIQQEMMTAGARLLDVGGAAP
mmetsp:Transcript_49183/g.88432  ORF Transcript_49183/g.88432 Transcript_49183/m.88432 type:complete len:198 (+) Transcript_49183:1-594(+)